MLAFCAAPGTLRRARSGWHAAQLSPRMSAEPLAARRSAGPALRRMAAAGQWSALAGAVGAMWARGKQSEDARPDERLVAMAASLAADAGEFQVAADLFSEMRAHDVEPGPHSYSVMLKARGRARDVPGVMRIVSELDAAPVALDTVLLNSVADALVRVGKLRDAEAFVSRETNAPLRDARTFNILIKGLVARRQIGTAFHVARSMSNAGFKPNDITRNTLLAGCVQAGDYTRAWQLANEIAGTPAVPAEAAPNQLSVAMTALLTAAAEAGRIGEARSLLGTMAARGAPATAVTYAALIRSCLRYGGIDGISAAEEVYESTPATVRCNVAVHNAFIGGLCRSGQRGAVHKALTAAFKMHKAKDPLPNEETYNALVDGCVRCMDLGRAESIVRIMTRNGTLPSVVTYTILIRGYGSRGQASRAVLAFSRMSRAGIHPDRVAFNALIAACARGGEVGFAKKILEGMEREGRDRGPTCASYAPVISAASRGRNLDSAWATYTRMKEVGVDPNEYVCDLMVSTLLKLGPDIVWSGRVDQRKQLAKRCCKILLDGANIGKDVRVLRKWRRQMLGIFGRKKQLARELQNVKLEKDITSASERIFESHGWNDIDSGFSLL